MVKQTAQWVTYGYLAVIHAGVAVLFAVSLHVAPPTEPVAAATTVARPAVTVQEIPIRPVVATATRVAVPSVGIDVPVRDGTYDADRQSWAIDDTAAFRADVTVPINNANGTTLIYGHARWPLFGALPDVRPGAEAYVYTAEGIRFVYTFLSSRQVDPADVSVLTSSGPPILLLQTCSGIFDAYRTLVAFELKEMVHDK